MRPAVDAVRVANDSPYGLSGTVGINGGMWYGAAAPFGGYQGSGIGRQCDIEGLEICTETKTVGWPAPRR